MCTPQFAAHAVKIVAVPLLLAGAVAGISPVVSAAASQARIGPLGPATSFTTSGLLYGVAATSARSAWAVGSPGPDGGRTLILRWNGTAWKQAPSPAGALLFGVAATSARSAWAVGDIGPGSKTLILRWNSTVWKRVPSPNPSAGGNLLSGVAATSARNAWAVGNSGSLGNKILILRWNGTVWK